MAADCKAEHSTRIFQRSWPFVTVMTPIYQLCTRDFKAREHDMIIHIEGMWISTTLEVHIKISCQLLEYFTSACAVRAFWSPQSVETIISYNGVQTLMTTVYIHTHYFNVFQMIVYISLCFSYKTINIYEVKDCFGQICITFFVILQSKDKLISQLGCFLYIMSN